MEFDRTLDAASVSPARSRGNANEAGDGATVADHTLPLAGAPGVPANLRSTLRSVLPRVEPGDGGAPLLIHEEAERFVRRASLGVGGMGEVERALDRDIGRDVAIKRMLPDAAGAAGIARFVTEVRVVGALEHPNVVPLHDVGVDADGRYFFVMKYVEGKTVESIIEELRRGDPEAVATWTFERRIELFVGVLRALAFAHGRGIVHRDVKPANIMVGRLGEVWLMDWGVAKVLEDGAPSLPRGVPDAVPSAPAPSGVASLRTTRHGTLVGTPAYMSPEQATAKSVTGRSDLYAAAVVFYELLALEHYLDAHMTSFDALLRAVQTVEIPLHRGGPHPPVPAELIHFCRIATAKDPALRYASAEAMIAELQAVLAGKVPVRCPVTLTKRVARELGRFVDRYPFVAMGGLIVSVLGLFGATITAAALALHR